MQGFTYIYKKSDGSRHEAEIEAESRDAAFAALRAHGIRPIKVVAKDGSKANGASEAESGVDGRDAGVRIGWKLLLVVGLILGVALVVASVAMLRILSVSLSAGARNEQGASGRNGQERTAIRTMAIALPRQQIHGDRFRIEAAIGQFEFKLESLLARFAEPGRAYEKVDLSGVDEDDAQKALCQKIWFSSDEFSEIIDLKRIVTGMKSEMSDYIKAGGGVREYLQEVVKRQNREIDCRDKASKRLEKMLLQVEEHEMEESRVYDFWLKANARLESMGIYPIPIPEALCNYQQTLMY